MSCGYPVFSTISARMRSFTGSTLITEAVAGVGHDSLNLGCVLNCCSYSWCRSRSTRLLRTKFGSPIVHEADHMSECGKIAQFDFVVAGNAVCFANRGHDLGLLHGIDTQIRLKIEIQIEHVHRIAGLLGDQRQHSLFHRIAFGRRCWRRDGSRCRRFCFHSRFDDGSWHGDDRRSIDDWSGRALAVRATVQVRFSAQLRLAALLTLDRGPATCGALLQDLRSDILRPGSAMSSRSSRRRCDRHNPEHWDGDGCHLVVATQRSSVMLICEPNPAPRRMAYSTG